MIGIDFLVDLHSFSGFLVENMSVFGSCLMTKTKHLEWGTSLFKVVVVFDM